MWAGFALAFLFLLASAARADILFFDLNNSPQEVAAAEKAAKARGEKVLVYPIVKSEDSARLQALQNELNQIRRSFLNASSTDRRSAERRYRELEDERRKISKRIRFGRDAAMGVLKDLNERGVKVNTIIMSGHDGNGDFSGKNGGLSSQSLMEIVKDNPAIRDSVKSVFLAGCYTVKPGTMEFNWQEAFPNLKIMAGYPGEAPANDKLAGHQFMERFLSRESTLLNQRNPASLREEVRRIIPPEIASTAAICLPDKKYATRSGIDDMEKTWKRCEELREIMRNDGQIDQCFQRALVGCENPPADTHDGPLRNFYRAIQETRPCRYNPRFRDMEIPNGERVIRLIYWKNILKNFTEENTAALEETKKNFLMAGMPEALADKITKLKDMSRKEILDYIREIEEYVRINMANDRDLKDPERAVGLLATKNAAKVLREHLAELSPDCIPFHWVEGDSNDHSNCGAGRSLGSRGLERARLELPIRRIDEERYRLISQFGYGDRDSSRSQNGYGGARVGDPVVSDAAADRSARLGLVTGGEEAIRARLDLLETERQIAQYRLAGTAADDMVGDRRQRTQAGYSYGNRAEEIERLERRLPAMRERVARAGDPVNVEELRRNPEAYFTAALAGVARSRTEIQDQLAAAQVELASARRELNEEQDPTERRLQEHFVRLYQDRIGRLEEEARNLPAHEEYLANMRRVRTSETPDPVAQARLNEIIASRVTAMRDEQIVRYSEQIRMLNQILDQCSQAGDSECRSNLTEIRSTLNWATQRMRTLQEAGEMQESYVP